MQLNYKYFTFLTVYEIDASMIIFYNIFLTKIRILIQEININSNIKEMINKKTNFIIKKNKIKRFKEFSFYFKFL